MKILLSFVLIGLLLRFPESSSRAAVDALRIWGLDVVPSLFPYMVLSRTLASALSTRQTSAEPAIWLLGLLGGSPSGAAALLACASSMQKRKLLALSALTGCISPMFLLHTAASWANDVHFGRMLLISHLSSALMAYFVVLWLYRKEACPIKSAIQQSSTENPISQSVSSVLNVGGCIVFFSVMASVSDELLPFLSDSQRAFLHSVMEISGGLHAQLLSAASGDTYVLCAGLSGFGGLSILFQNYLFLEKAGVKFSELLLFGLFRAAGASAVMTLLLAVFP